MVSTLIGIAIGEGSIAGVDQTLAELLPRYADVMKPGVAGTMLEQILTMTGGFVGEGDPDGFAFMNSPNPTRAALDSATAPPGEQFAHSNAGARHPTTRR